MGAETSDTRGEGLTESGSAKMNCWTTSRYGIETDDGKSDEEKYPPPPGAMTPVPEESTAVSLNADPQPHNGTGQAEGHHPGNPGGAQ